LTVLKQVEENLGRVPTIRNGPRTLDLDILLYDDQIINHPDLIVPHMSMLERSFVLQPLADLAPKALHPLSFATIQSHLTELPPPAQHQVIPLRHGKLELDIAHHRKRTLIMGILNLTPDSFSDGGVHSLLPAEIVATVQKMVDNGADIIDVGGQSTRPDAEDVGPAAEIERVIPAIKAIREAGLQVPLSIDTYRADVARAAIDAGADIINDVSAGTLDPKMFTVAAELNVPIILMHMRGTPKTMNSLAKYDDMIPEIASELFSRVDEAVKAGIRRWNILLDPGLGFAKIRAQNLEVLRCLEELRRADGLGGLGWIVGPSRKSFVGWVTGETVPWERVWGTAAAVTACVAGGADIVRVHDVGEMGRVVKMGDAIWRGVR
jgi:dihydroneopterin aldolase / 2-amino-4-hydroxy-6-hydroxymethyldihydropteridine diphosphokinase / dihydropteroate synthase